MFIFSYDFKQLKELDIDAQTNSINFYLQRGTAEMNK